MYVKKIVDFPQHLPYNKTMDQRAFYNLSYGVFILGTKADDKINACITNTCFQAAASPVRIAISCINNNHTCQMIKE